MESFEEGLKLRSLKILDHREIENPDFSYTQECSNDRVHFQHSTSVLIEGMGVPRMP